MTVATCCRPPMTDAEWQGVTERLARAHERVVSRYPTRCPHCGSKLPVPAWIDGADVWRCGDHRCGRLFTAGD